MSEHNKTEFEDLNRELSGANNAKITRFFDEASLSGGKAEDKEAKARRAFLTQLEYLMQDQNYRKARQEFGDYLQGVEQATETVLKDALRDYGLSEEHLEDICKNANRLPDGRMVFRDENGQVVSGDGREVSADDAASIVWQDGAPSYEDYQAAKRNAETSRQTLEEIEGYQRDVLGPARDRFDSEDPPMTQDEFDEQKKRIDQHMPDYVREIYSPAVQETQLDNASAHQPVADALVREL